MKDDVTKFWQTWSPHLAYLENNHLDLPTLHALDAVIEGPVLIVGAGQGLLVAELRAQGFQADGIDSSDSMVAYAAERRHVELIHGDARELPFSEGSYQTTIIATGVIDFLDDEDLIGQILDEAIRVTRKGGSVLAAFYKPHPVAERFLTRIGVITPEGRIRQRRIFDLSRLNPWSFVQSIRQDTPLSLPAALIELARMRIGLPAQERAIGNNLAKILRAAENPDELINAVPETIPYRTPQRIGQLFERLKKPLKEVWVFDPCIVVSIGPGTR